VGKRNLEEAIAAFPGATFNVQWKPFLLNSSIPAAGQSIADYLANVYGAGMDVQGAMQRLQQAGLRCTPPIKFDYSNSLVTPTMDSHRLIELARGTCARVSCAGHSPFALQRARKQILTITTAYARAEQGGDTVATKENSHNHNYFAMHAQKQGGDTVVIRSARKQTLTISQSLLLMHVCRTRWRRCRRQRR
jgi:hypothetical protein